METMKKKCPQCGLVNFSNDMECRRCGGFLKSSVATHCVSEQKKSQLSSALAALVAFLLVAGGIWYWSSKTNSNQPVLYNPENLPQATITSAPKTPLENINPHDDEQVQKMIVPMDNERVKQFHEQKQKTVEDLGKHVQKPFANGPPE